MHVPNICMLFKTGDDSLDNGYFHSYNVSDTFVINGKMCGFKVFKFTLSLPNIINETG